MGLHVQAKANQAQRIYCTFDDSIVKSGSDIPKYLETHDVKYLEFEDVDEDADQFGPAEFWCTMPSWDDFESTFWQSLGVPRKMALEAFRLYCQEFKNFRWRSEKGEILTLTCAKTQQLGKNQTTIRPEILGMIPEPVQFNVGMSILVLAGITEKAEEVTNRLIEETKGELRVIPKELEKNSSASASSNGSTESASSAGAVQGIPT